MTDDMDPGELQTVREYLGLTTEALAGMLAVRHDTVRKWESGRFPVPDRVREEVEKIEEYTARGVDEIVTALMDSPDPAVRVYRTDAELHAARPDLAHLPARWWRHVAYRAAEQVPGTAIVSRDVEADPDSDAALERGRRDLADRTPSSTPDAPVELVRRRLHCDRCDVIHPMNVALIASDFPRERCWCHRVHGIVTGSHRPGTD